jgi:carboxyl-terminal processing protease
MRRQILAGAAAVAFLALSGNATTARSDTYQQLNLFGDIFEKIRADYVEEVDDAKLIEAAINGMLASLDPHSSYLNPKNYRDMQVSTRGTFGGLGIEVTMENGLVKVVAPIDDTPADRAGIKSGDLITSIDDEPVLGLTLGEAVERMRGPVDSQIKLTVGRVGEEKPIEVTITRAVIKVRSTKGRREGNVAYIRISSFNEQTTKGLQAAMTELKKDIGPDFEGVVLDLRRNPGGLLNEAVSVSDAFLDQGEIVSTRGRQSGDTQRFNARGGDLAEGKPMVVLINGGSASASEIVAGALQDHRRAIVLGTRSFGKGSVQTIIPMQGRGALRLTTQRYYTPSGRSIQAKGIEPDITVEEARIEAQETGKRRTEADLRHHLEGGTPEKEGESKVMAQRSEQAQQDYQLSRALDLIRGISLMTAQAANN